MRTLCLTDEGFRHDPRLKDLLAYPLDWSPAWGTAANHRRRRWSFPLAETSPTASPPVFVKYFLPRHTRERLKYRFLSTRAKTEWVFALRLLKLDIPTPRPLALIERRRWYGWCQSILAVQSITPGQTLLEFSESQPDTTARRRVSASLARNLARLHLSGLYHRDLHGNNILLHDPPVEADPYFIDLHEMCRRRRRSRRLALADLARLNGFVAASPRERLRFARVYFDTCGIPSSAHRNWVDTIDRLTRRLWQQYRKKGRRYARY